MHSALKYSKKRRIINNLRRINSQRCNQFRKNFFPIPHEKEKRKTLVDPTE